jgi:hypothetical protein
MKYEYTYKIQQLFPEQGSMLVEYTPGNTSLMKISYNVPILIDFDINDMATYLEKYAPHDRWYAQELILNSSEILLGNQ